MFSEYAKLPIYDILKRPKKLADVGIELEVEGKYLPESVPISGWSVKQEGSLQGGWEYISKPIKAGEVEPHVTALHAYLKSFGSGPYKAQILPSYRCSTHIHVNMTTETLGDFLGFIVIFTMFEPVLLSLCGPQRDGNLFCLSHYDTGDVVSSFDTLCSTFHYVRDYGFHYDRGKYAALNLGRLGDLGTAEARCFPLSLDGAVVAKWVNWLMAMKDIAKSQPDKTYRELWKLVRQNPQWYAAKVFGSDIFNVPNVSHLVDFGTEIAYEQTKVLKKWYNHKEEPKKKRGPRKKTDPGLSGVYAANYTVDDLVPSVGLSTFSAAAPSSWSAAPQPYPDNIEEENGF
jgi:hypothetical protein